MDKKIVEKIIKAKNMGGENFPDPYTALWKYYSQKHGVKLAEAVRNVVRFAVLVVARGSAQPKQHTVLEIYNSGNILGEKGGKEHFNAADLNENFKSVLGFLVKKMKKDPKIKEKVFELYQRADDSTWNAGIAHLAREGAGSSLPDNARKQYIESVRNWFVTYLPTF